MNKQNSPACSCNTLRDAIGRFTQIVKLCEEYQNADVEGHDPDAIQADSDRRINAVCKTACEALSAMTDKTTRRPATKRRYNFCPECGQPMLRKGQTRRHPDDYRHAQGCPVGRKERSK